MIDRNAQFQPIENQLPQVKSLRIAADDATAALSANAALVNKLMNDYLAKKQKAGQFSGAQGPDFVALGNAQIALEAEQAKTAGFMSAAQNAVIAFRQAWVVGDGYYQNLLQDPGLGEMV